MSVLDIYREKQLQYFKENNPGCLCKDGFINGRFNRNNWNGGDLELIRDYFSKIENSDKWQQCFESDYVIDEEKDIYCLDVIVNFNYYNEQAYGSVIVRSNRYFDQYLFSWYKSRGTTEVALKNGRLMNENQYIELLKLLEIIK